jgi:hypothetical protein
MEREIDNDVCRYDHVCTPGHLAAMVFSHTHEDNAVLKTPEVITGNDPLWLGSRSIDGEPCQKAGAAYRPTPCLAERQKSNLVDNHLISKHYAVTLSVGTVKVR